MQPIKPQAITSPEDHLHGQYDLLKTEYIKLLNDKDVLLQWARPQVEALYITRIGYLQTERLQLQLSIKALKRKIELVYAAVNLDENIDINDIELIVAAELAEAEYRIMEEAAKLENSRRLLGNRESPERSAELRKLYKQLAKQLHPHVNDNLTGEQKNLWHLVKDAYDNGDPEELKAMQLVYEKELAASEVRTAKSGSEELTLKIEILKEGIRILYQQLMQIKNEFPFTVEEQIKDEEWVSAQTGEIKKELDGLRQYETELEWQYRQITSLI